MRWLLLQVWSITYHSWLTFVLLLWACLIWMVRARRHFATLCSPFILLYGLSLCSLQYVWGMDLELELPHDVGTMSLKQLGLDRTPHPCLRLGPMVRREHQELEKGEDQGPFLITPDLHPYLVHVAQTFCQTAACSSSFSPILCICSCSTR